MDLHATHQQQRLTVREQLTLSVLWFSMNSMSAAMLPIVIPTQILLFVAPGSIGNAQQATFLVSLSNSGAGAIRNGVGVFYILTSLALVCSVLVTVVGVHEVPFSPAIVASRSEESARVCFHRWTVHNWVEPWHNYNFTIVFLTRCSVMMGLALFLTFIEYFFAQVTHISNFAQATAGLAILALLGAVVSAFVLGIFSDRMRRAPVVCAAACCMGLAALTFVISPGNIALWPLGILFGLGYGAYTSVDWALSIDALPSLSTVGKDLGLWSASVTLPAIAAPLVGSIIIAIANAYGQTALGYRLIFAAATTFLFLGAFFVLLVRERRPIRPVDRPVLSTPSPIQAEAQSQTQAQAKPRVQVQTQAARRSVGFGWKFAFQTRAGKARGFLRVWPIWEAIYRRVCHIMPISLAPHHLIEVQFAHHHGKPIDLPDGLHVNKGDPIIGLHFNNRVLLDIASDVSLWKLVLMMMEDLQALAMWTQEADFPGQKVRVLCGVTLLSRGAPRLGFTLRERPRTFYTWLDRFFMIGLLVLYHQKGIDRLLQGTTYGTRPQEIWMSRDELLKLYSLRA